MAKEHSENGLREYSERIKKRVYDRLDMTGEIEDVQLKNIIGECVQEESGLYMISIREKEELEETLFNAIRRLDVLQELLEDDTITEIMINGQSDIFLERDGKITRWDKTFESETRLEDIAQKIAALSNKIVNASVPIADTRLGDGSRVSIVLPPVALNGPVITIRKFYREPLTMEKLIGLNSITREAAEFLEYAVRAKYNIFISGGTGSGKTTFLNALSGFIPKDERVITIEDSAELQIEHVENLVRLEARDANIEGKNAVKIRDLIRASLRMRPDRIIVGEVRGEETLDMVQAMSTGHDGSLSTGHGNSPKDMAARLETMILMGMDMPVSAIRQQLSSAIDIIVHLGRLRDKTRRVLQIVEIKGINKGEIEFNTLFEFKETGEKEGRITGSLTASGRGLVNCEKMYAAGFRMGTVQHTI
jgi:pilus assembly protein CpaF